MDDSIDPLNTDNLVGKPKTKTKNPKKYLESRKRYHVKLQVQNKISNQHVESLRALVPGMSDKIDKAGALEKAAEYIMAFQTKAGSSMEEIFCKYLEENTSCDAWPDFLSWIKLLVCYQRINLTFWYLPLLLSRQVFEELHIT